MVSMVNNSLTLLSVCYAIAFWQASAVVIVDDEARSKMTGAKVAFECDFISL
jgi:hypothetical protein